MLKNLLKTPATQPPCQHFPQLSLGRSPRLPTLDPTISRPNFTFTLHTAPTQALPPLRCCFWWSLSRVASLSSLASVQILPTLGGLS